jgi:cytochrome c2
MVNCFFSFIKTKVFTAGVMFAILAAGVVLAGSASPGLAAPASQVLPYYAQWEKSGHANQATANYILDDRASKNQSDRTCLACHTGQGYIEYVSKNFMSPTGPDDKGYWPTLPEKGTARSQTCSACHKLEALQTAKAGDPVLRYEGDVPVTPGGFAVKGAERGAMCITCHNSRRGLHNDTTRPKMNDRAPHETAQADVLMGENFFFVKTGTPGGHAALPGLCVNCHMNVSAANKKLATTDHTFHASFDDCKSCHDPKDPMTGPKLKETVKAKRDSLQKKIEAALTAFVQAGMAKGNIRMVNRAKNPEEKNYTTFTKGSIGNGALAYDHGRQALKIKVENEETLAQLAQLEGGGIALPDSVEGQVILRAGWNLFMLDHDHSNGAHNPKLVTDALDATLKKMDATNFKVITALPKK